MWRWLHFDPVLLPKGCLGLIEVQVADYVIAQQSEDYLNPCHDLRAAILG